jgi:outer membrane protein assembly factor BamE (lipoprotein component of BamABCDE complex)
MKIGSSKLAFAMGCALMLAGCAGVRAHKGAVIDPQLASAVQVGVDNKASVEKTLGRPTFTGEFSDKDWYYVSRDTNQFAFRNPRVAQQTVLHVRFDQAGNVVSVQRTGRELIASINPVNKKTPTLGRKRSFFEEIFGNIGTVGTGGQQGSPGY